MAEFPSPDKPLLAVTMGDPAGIGPEIIFKALFSERAQNAARMVVIGHPDVFARDARLLNLDIGIRIIDSPEMFEDKPGILNLIIPPGMGDIPLACSTIDARCGLAAAKCIELSVELAMKGLADAIVTAPINKEALALAGYPFPGHTEFYRHLTGAADTAMMLTLGVFRVVHVTTHVPIRDVPGFVKKERIVRVAMLFAEALELLGVVCPRIAISGLNPHAGESGLMGAEEADEIVPAVNELRGCGMDVTGPLPPDTVFARAYCGEFDGVVAMYHDQGHIALKLAGFTFRGESREIAGVNTTLGLPIVRTSVDHGTAFDIAGKGIASPISLLEAIELAAALAGGKHKTMWVK